MPQQHRLFRFVSRFPYQIVILAIIISALSVCYTVKNITFLTGRDDLMPQNAPFQADYRAYRNEFGDQEEIVVVIESDEPSKTLRAADALYARLNGEKRLFREIFYPGGLPLFRSNGMLFLPLEELQQLRKTLTMAAPVLRDLAASPSVESLFLSLTRQIDGYLSHGDRTTRESLAFMLTALNKGFSAASGVSAPESKPQNNSSLSLDSFLKGGSGADSMLERAGRQQIITMTPIKDPDSFVAAEKSILAAQSAVKDILGRAEFKGVTAGLTGVPVLEYEEMKTSQHDLEIATVLSLALTVALLLFAFRGIINVIAAMTALISALCLSFGFATATVGHLNILSMVFAVMLIGLGIEYGIQIILRFQEELKKGVHYREALETGIGGTFRSIVMAASTVAMAFITFAFTDFKGIAELGIIAAGGVVMCVITTFTVLPAMLMLLERFRKKTALPMPASHTDQKTMLVGSVYRYPKTTCCITLFLVLGSLYPALTMEFDYNLMNLQAKGLPSVEYAYKLMRSKENSGYFAVVAAQDLQEVRELTRRFELLPAVDHVVSTLSFVPDQQKEKLSELAYLSKIMATVKPVPYEETVNVMALPTVFEDFHGRVEQLKTALEREKAPEAGAVATFLTTLTTFFTTLEKEKDRNALGMLRNFQGELCSELPSKLITLKESLIVSEVYATDVPPQLEQRFRGKSGTYLMQISPRKEIFEATPLKEFVSQVKSVAPHATGEPVMVLESLTIMRDSYQKAFIFAFIGITAIVLINFRNVRFALLGLLPLGVGLLLMVGGMGALGIRFNSANIIVLPLILGVGIDSAIYIINRYRQGAETPGEVAAGSAGVGVFLNALTILSSFGTLMVARHQGVFSIGAVMSLGMTATVVAFLLFLPSLLSLWGKRT